MGKQERTRNKTKTWLPPWSWVRHESRKVRRQRQYTCPRPRSLLRKRRRRRNRRGSKRSKKQKSRPRKKQPERSRQPKTKRSAKHAPWEPKSDISCGNSRKKRQRQRRQNRKPQRTIPDVS